MKKHEKYPVGQMMLLCILAAGWWGLLYPEFGVNGEILTVSEESGEPVNPKDAEKTEVFLGLLDADLKDIKINSKMLEMLLQQREKE